MPVLRSVGWLAVLLVLAALPARADLLADRLRLSMYGRMGLAWTPQGDSIQGRRLSVTGGPLGGRLEEGDYLEPTVALHLIPPPQDLDEAFVRLVMTPALLSSNGLILSAFSSDFARTLRIELFQAYVEAGNFWLPDLKVWAGARFYRGTDVHISDFFYFNNLTGQGVGLQYRKLDVTVLLRTSENNALYNVDLDGDGEGKTRRQRTVFVGQYVHEFTERFETHLLSELHLLPASSVVADLLATKKLEASLELAWTAKEAMVAHMNGHYALNDHGVKTAPFYVLRFTSMPSILAEIAYISNPAEEALLRTPAFVREVAESLFRGVQSFLTSTQSAVR